MGANQQILAALKVAAAGGCNTGRDSILTSDNSANIAQNFGELIAAFQFTALASFTLCAADLTVGRVNSSSDLVYAELYADNGGGLVSSVPTGTALTTSTGIALSALSAGSAVQKFADMNYAITITTILWLAFRKATNDNTNYSRLFCQNTTGVRVAKNDGSWAYFADRRVNFTLYSA